MTAEAACAGVAADAGGAESSLSGANESGAPEVSGTSPIVEGVAVPDFTVSGDGGCVRSIGLAGSGGTVGK